ncbi:phosphodiester glycosidase family protein [uncultured Mitsuokella sp.]|uniref:phosphodiester glycosidase family protein n=1 Tax=uncultured Mitsuokella sp. TaxID=453120 RepID=UPI00267098A4|nr:phosphodiester glycosidase family protein [uncultured Mitsuokella sp.]
MNIRRICRRAAVFAAAAVFLMQSFAMAAGLTSMRFHSGSEHDRVVYEFTTMPVYTTSVSADGRTLTLDLANTSYQGFQAVPANGTRISSISYNKKGNHLLVTMKLKAGLSYQVRTLKNPTRLFVDVLPSSEITGSYANAAQNASPASVNTNAGSTKNTSASAKQDRNSSAGSVSSGIDGDYVQQIAPGLVEHTYVYWDDYGKISAWLLEADPARYKLVPVLAKGKIPGREAVSGIVARAGGVAGINGSYFAPDGDLIGVTKMNGQIVGTTYYTRSAFGLKKDGTPIFGKISYNGTVTMGGVNVSVGGVDCERGADSLVIYNRAYGSTTGTNEYGREYVVRNGRVTDIRQNDSPIPADGVVISVHGTVADELGGVEVGDPVKITEDLGDGWQDADFIVGVGPRLVANGRVNVTADEEEFPADIRIGRAPRSAVGITKDGKYLLAVVDGRQSHSVGLTLTDWARLLVKFGARDALNLDGGGSSDLVINGEVQNSPSDGQERAVGDALVLVRK